MSSRKVRPHSPDNGALRVSHIRRCHVCGAVNESEGSANLKCKSCGKHLAPFYYFEESKLEGISVEDAYLSQWKLASEFNPIYGLSMYWTDQETKDDDEGHHRRYQKGSKSSPSRHSKNRGR